MPVVQLEDAYNGKLMAVLDRQHPCDLCDGIQFFKQLSGTHRKLHNLT